MLLTELLESENIVVCEFHGPLYPDEREVTLIEGSGGALPEAVIVKKYAVSSDGKRV